ncbi:hypothetical protein F3N42_06520 [Marinihelvus fidelis]|uniref:Uncharacterized protein n=1 Tax=Marinihelvus fidelis TaxID=2613842 RepID=A0A5N0TA67_9GAMM|nr:hypothetical protein [Marinihelvus fidelis]KAA9131830.1 hypothetical protein F3N42_06520 [Marinihelvus fidelis]
MDTGQASNRPPPGDVNGWTLVVATAMTVFTAYLYRNMHYTGGLFRALFSNIIDEIPLVTRLLLWVSDWAYVLLAASLVPLALLFLQQNAANGLGKRRFLQVTACVFVAVLLTGAHTLAMYQAPVDRPIERPIYAPSR